MSVAAAIVSTVAVVSSPRNLYEIDYAARMAYTTLTQNMLINTSLVTWVPSSLGHHIELVFVVGFPEHMGHGMPLLPIAVQDRGVGNLRVPLSNMAYQPSAQYKWVSREDYSIEPPRAPTPLITLHLHHFRRTRERKWSVLRSLRR